MDIDINYIKITFYLVLFIFLVFSFKGIFIFWKKRQYDVVIPYRTKARGVIEERPEFTSIETEQRHFVENISSWALPKAFWGALALTVVSMMILG